MQLLLVNDHLITEVLKYEITRYDGGMENPEYRRVTLQHLFAFETVTESQWKKFLDWNY